MTDQRLKEVLRDRPDLIKLLTPKWSKYIPSQPTLKQEAFLLLDDVREVLFGGSAGGGKSECILMAALQYVDYPKYSALIVRATYKDLSLPGAIMDRAFAWLKPTDAKWDDQKKTWVFPSGARLTFGHLDGENSHFEYQGAEFQFIGVDEASQLRWNQVLYLSSRLRKTEDNPVPLRMRLATNPGGRSHAQIKQKFIDVNTREPGAVFIPSKLEDNPHLNKEEYEKSLQILDPVTREQLRNGNWDIEAEGGLFKKEWFRFTDRIPEGARILRFWDLAATEVEPGKDPDWTAGVKMALHNGTCIILDVRRKRGTPDQIEKFILDTAKEDGKKVAVRLEEEGGSAGKNTTNTYSKILLGYKFKGIRSTGSKEEYARPLSSAVENGRCLLMRGSWNGMFINECEAFPLGSHDDMEDAASKALACLTGKHKKAGVW